MVAVGFDNAVQSLHIIFCNLNLNSVVLILDDKDCIAHSAALMSKKPWHKVLPTLKLLTSSAYSWCRRHPVASSSGFGVTFVIGLLFGLLFAVFRSETVRTRAIIRAAGAGQSGVRYRYFDIHRRILADPNFV